jgi:hypothetical protein
MARRIALIIGLVLVLLGVLFYHWIDYVRNPYYVVQDKYLAAKKLADTDQKSSIAKMQEAIPFLKRSKRNPAFF